VRNLKTAHYIQCPDGFTDEALSGWKFIYNMDIGCDVRNLK